MVKRTRATKKKPEGEMGATTAEVMRRYGGNAVRTGSNVLQPDRISTGAFVLDLALLGGYPHNRQSMLIGDRSAGKSTMTCKMIASVQKQFPEHTPVLVDVEGTFDSVWAEALGVDTDRLLVAGAETGEMAVDIADAYVGTEETSLVIVDSIAALAPSKEIETSAEDAHIGLQARIVNRMVRKITASLVKERARNHFVTVLYVNQWRTKIGGFSPSGDPRVMPGGRAIEAACTLQVEIKNKENKGRNKEDIELMTYNEHPYRILKNKMNQGPRTGEFTLLRDDDVVDGAGYGEIDNAPTLLTYAKKFGYYTGAGTNQNLEFETFNMKFGKQDQCIQMLREDRKVQAHLWWVLVAHQAESMGMPKEFIKRLLAMKKVYT